MTVYIRAYSKLVWIDFERFIPKPVWAVGFALEQTLHVVALTVFSYVDFKVASAY
ncbi:MAG: hypothetical protein LBH59_02810 [Planctomycetaceae bacterium]|nr:hypothetical protein [Planctomycetaceae bacterium]